MVFHSVGWSGDVKAIYEKVTLAKIPADEV
jgi:hypothetical protein